LQKANRSILTRSRRRGFTLVETLMAVGFMAFVIMGAVQLTLGVGRSFHKTTAQIDVDMNASAAVQWMNRDLQEAKQVDITTETHLVVRYPVIQPDGSYNRAILDPNRIVEYYRGDANGTKNPQGDYLLRSATGEATRPVCRNVSFVHFESWNPSSVDISLTSYAGDRFQSATTEMIHRAIFLRNY
jgi:type II secretory pathway pseudopilin PulG